MSTSLFEEILQLEAALVASHKLAPDGGPRLRPLVQSPPPNFNAALEVRTMTYAVSQADVLEVWLVARQGAEAQKAAVDAEASRRILAVLPSWKQTNMIARSVELQQIAAARALSADELGEHAAMAAAWAWVKAVRAASNVLNAANPIPLDFAEDTHWPAPL